MGPNALRGRRAFLTWLRLGMKNGWIGPPVCDTHDGTPTSEEEDESDYDCCVHVVRLYADLEPVSYTHLTLPTTPYV